MKHKRVLALICIFALVIGTLAYKTGDDVYGETNYSEDVAMSVDEKGNIDSIEIEDVDNTALETALKLSEKIDVSDPEEVNEVYEGEGQVVQLTSANAGVDSSTTSSTGVTFGMVIFNQSSTVTTSFTNVETGYTGCYLSGALAPEAAYLGTDGNGNVLFKQADVYGKVSASLVNVVAYSDSLYTSRYKVSNGKIYHYITTNLTSAASSYVVGYTQSYMSEGATYFSYDGHYFYTNYKVMLDDYMNHTYVNSINSTKPYYNYYQYLSHRSTTTLTGEQIDAYIYDKITQNYSSLQSYIDRYLPGTGLTPYDSKLIGIGADLIKAQNTYGVNALLVLGVAINESYYGCSSKAFTTNNLFGHAVYDSDTSSGSVYGSVYAGIVGHMEVFLSDGYLNPWNWKYFGTNLGDKQSGLNVKYASDPYWGEKAAASGYAIKDYLNTKNVATNDLYYYSIGYVSNITKVYNQASTTSAQIYTTASGATAGTDNVLNSPILVLENLNNGWMKIQSDGPLNSERTTRNFTSSSAGTYSYSRDYVYAQNTNFKSIVNYDIYWSPGSAIIPITGVTLNSTSLTINRNATSKLTATIIPSNTSNSKTITWSSSNTNVATVDSSGNVKGINAGNATITATTSNGLSASCAVTVNVVAPTLTYSAHVQSIGWQPYVFAGATAGTTDQSLRIEGLYFDIDAGTYGGTIEYRSQVQTYGWQDWVSDYKLTGTVGEAKRLEAIQIRLTGELAQYFDVVYRVYVQNFGWLDWAKNGESAGTATYGYRMEAIEAKIVPKGTFTTGSNPYESRNVKYNTHVQSFGWQAYSYDGELSGTVGLAKRLEALTLSLGDLGSVDNVDYSNSGITYRSHVQTFGWESTWKTNSQTSGTTGLGKRLEAVQILLTGDLASKYDIVYRVHVQHFGWLDWAKNGESAGTEGFGYRMEAIEIKLVPKGTVITNTAASFKKAT